MRPENRHIGGVVVERIGLNCPFEPPTCRKPAGLDETTLYRLPTLAS